MWYALTSYFLVCALLCWMYLLQKKAAEENRIVELNAQIAKNQIEEEKRRIFHLLYELEDRARLCALRYGNCLVNDEFGQQLLADYFVHVCKRWMQIRYPKYECTWQVAVLSMIECQKNDFGYSRAIHLQHSIVQLEAKLLLDRCTVAGSFSSK